LPPHVSSALWARMTAPGDTRGTRTVRSKTGFGLKTSRAMALPF
jgi:hypothetical protein